MKCPDNETGFDLARIGIGALWGVIAATLNVSGAYWAATILLILGVAIITYTWPYKSKSVSISSTNQDKKE